MLIYSFSSPEAVGKFAANLIQAQVNLKPSCVLGLATGSTPLHCYGELIRKYQKKEVDFSQVTTLNLDEYLGLSPKHDQSYRYFMEKNLFSQVGLTDKQTHVPTGESQDSEKEARDYEKLCLSHPTDLQLLGIGANGHIGFNEPSSSFALSTHIVELTEKTRQDNSRFFASLEEVPKKAITMGIGTIMRAKKILLLATGSSKAQAIQKTVQGPITPETPASILQLHQDVVLVTDLEAASLLNEQDLPLGTEWRKEA